MDNTAKKLFESISSAPDNFLITLAHTMLTELVTRDMTRQDNKGNPDTERQRLKESIAFMLRYATRLFDNDDMAKFVDYLKRIEQRASI